MKRFLLLAAVVVGVTFCGFSSTAKANGWHYGWRGGYGPYRGYWGPRPYGYRYRPFVAAPGVFIGGPRIGIGVGVAPAYSYPAPYPAYGYGYPGYGAW